MIDKEKALELAERLHNILSPEGGEGALLVFQRKLLEHIYKELLMNVPLVFNGLFARMQYFHDNNDVPAELVRRLNTLRILANRAAHEEIAEIPAGAVIAGAKSIYELLKFVCPELSYPLLEDVVKDAPELPRHSHSKKHSFHCILKSHQFYMSGASIAGLEIQAINEDNEEVSILLRDDSKHPEKAKFSSLMPSLWPYANLHCLELSEVAGKANFYVDNPRSIVVLEPDFLIDASSIAECMDKDKSAPELYVLNRLFGEASSESMLLGRMVNSIFDELIHQPDLDYLDLFKCGLSQMPIPMVALGQNCAMEIYREIEIGHLQTVRAFCADVPEDDLLLEPSFLCPAYGLQGRLDLLYKNKGKYNIVELKSGKAHPNDVWPNQLYQVVAYNMIIRCAYGAGNLGSSSIFYSASMDKPLRNVANIPLLEQNLMHCRNRIVGIMHLLSENPRIFFDWLAKQDEKTYSVFSAEALQRFKRLKNSIRDFEYEWFCEQVKRVIREIWYVKTGAANSEAQYGHNALWRLSPVEKQGKIIKGLHIEDSNQREIKLSYSEDPGISDFRQGDIVVFYEEHKRVDKQEIIRGVITRMDKDNLCLRIRGGIKRRFNPQSSWSLEHDMLESYLYGPLSALTTFLESEISTRDLFLGIREPAAIDVDCPKDERESILARMQAARELFIVQGPPGTGKTSGLIGNYTERFFKNTKKTLMVLSFTNRAVDEICMCLKARNVPFIRTGNSQNIEDELLENLIHDKRYQEIDHLLRQNRIFVATVQSANAWIRDLTRLTGLDEIIVDEASQILESSILGLVTMAPKTILIGDQNQLPAISMQESLSFHFESEVIQELEYNNINQSLMERLFRLYHKKAWQKHLEMLTGHYRMHNEIAALVSHYYENRLRASLKEQSAVLETGLLPEEIDTRLLWLECPPSPHDYYDPLQTKAIVKLVDLYRKAGLVNDLQKDLGIVAPYRLMIHALRQEIKDISIDTVERYQGSERDSIILCFPIRNTMGLRSLQSLSSDGRVDRKLNVALSRARNRLIVIANSSLCKASVHFTKLYDNIRQNGRILSIHDFLDKE
ncbi:MAG: AAA domain-containing protein [Candidatus Cloacimonetes bacterium]|nr:AAA domain-containing protein [Candidatus Cloacimonadota bacterium]MDD4559933.1 AAA domain-containing protein [Candidatus Cloacimonadota bacterium]